mmetsp:Transcript_24200/g.67293  ORF Transcript_24200/g.67293 Transcript_24200/m.67293 type:complete len:217 (+) Transcript_24200:106-756(+)
MELSSGVWRVGRSPDKSSRSQLGMCLEYGRYLPVRQNFASSKPMAYGKREKGQLMPSQTSPVSTERSGNVLSAAGCQDVSSLCSVPQPSGSQVISQAAMSMWRCTEGSFLIRRSHSSSLAARPFLCRQPMKRLMHDMTRRISFILSVLTRRLVTSKGRRKRLSRGRERENMSYGRRWSQGIASSEMKIGMHPACEASFIWMPREFSVTRQNCELKY